MTWIRASFIGVLLTGAAQSSGQTVCQVASDPSFTDQSILFEEAGAAPEDYTLPDVLINSLSIGEDYYLRTNAGNEWSSPAPFRVERKAVYSRPPHIEQTVWEKVEPYLLPEDHPIKASLDNIFSQSRAILSVKSMKKAGFVSPKPRKWTHVVVTTHPQVPGYIFKVYLDAQRNFRGKKEYDHWVDRIEGVGMIQTEIEKRGLEHLFKTPRKWIYMLPEEPSPPKEFKRKNFILIAEDMDIFSREENYSKWQSGWVTKEKLKIFYSLCEDLGLHDCAKPDNAPFSKDGKIAFIDTQGILQWPVKYKKMTPYLTKEMKAYWKKLTKGSRKKTIAGP